MKNYDERGNRSDGKKVSQEGNERGMNDKKERTRK